MFGYRKSPAKISKQASVDPGFTISNPLDSDAIKPARRTSSEPVLIIPPNFDPDDNGRWTSSSFASPYSSAVRNKQNLKDLENMSVQELESHAVNQAEETTKSVNGCLKIAEDIREDATRTLDMLNQQGEQITRTHLMAADMDHDLSFGEKLLGNLGGMFSKTWKPKKGRDIAGPLIMKDDNFRGKQNKTDQREKLGLAPLPKGRRIRQHTPPPEPTNALQKVEASACGFMRFSACLIRQTVYQVEKAKQDDVLSDLSNILGDLKGMAIDIGTEVDRQNNAIDHLQDDVGQLNSRVKGANQHARRLIGK